MIRELLLAAGVLTIVAGCAAPGTPAPSPPAARGWSPTVGRPRSSGPTGITSPDAARVAPLAPARLTAVVVPVAGGGAGAVRLAWPATGEDLAYYECLRRTPSGGEWRTLERIPPERLTCVDSAPGGGIYVYGIRAVAVSGLASAITESGAVTVP